MPVLALASLLASADNIGAVGHGCDGMTMEHCQHGDRNTALADACAAVSCGQAQTAPPAFADFFSRVASAASTALLPQSDRKRVGVLGSPELRPPIA